MIKIANPGEQVTLRAAITKAEKAARVAALAKEAATNAASTAAAIRASAEEAMNKADRDKVGYNDIVAAFHAANAAYADAHRVETEAIAADFDAKTAFTLARATAEEAYAI